MEIQARLNLSGKDVLKHPQGAHHVLIDVFGTEVDMALHHDASGFYILLNTIDTRVPTSFKDNVTCITSRDQFAEASKQYPLLVPGIYVSKSGRARAEIREEFLHGGLRRIVDIRCESLASWKLFRPLVLSGQARQTRSYVPVLKTATTPELQRGA